MKPSQNQPYKPKPQRNEETGYARFLTFGCYHHKRLFNLNILCRLFINQLFTWQSKTSIEIWAYVIMPNHVHLVLFPPDNASLRRSIQAIKRKFSYDALKLIKEKQPKLYTDLEMQEKGKVVHKFWQPGGGYDRSLNNKESILNAIKYIHGNPVRSGIVDDEFQYKWSSAVEWEKGEYKLIRPDSFPI